LCRAVAASDREHGESAALLGADAFRHRGVPGKPNVPFYCLRMSDRDHI
jgi:hypothetical protein